MKVPYVIFACLIFTLINLNFLNCIQNEFSVIVDPGQRECFHQNLIPNLNVYVDFQVIQGGELDITFWLGSPSNRIIINEMQKNVGQYHFKTDETGEYHFCFDNSFSRFALKKVFFYMYTAEVYVDPDFPVIDVDLNNKFTQDEMGELENRVEDFKSSFIKLNAKLEEIQRYQSVFRIYETIDRFIMDSNISRVNFWSIVNITVMILVGVTQVIMIRSLFEDKSKLGRVLRSGKAAFN